MPQKKTKKEKEAKADSDSETEAKPAKEDPPADVDDKKKKKSKDDAKDEKKEKKEKKQKRKPTPLVCSVLEISPVPKKNNLKVCKIRFMEDMESVDIVTNAPNLCVGGKFVVALPGVTTANGIEVDEKDVGGVHSCGMFCGPEEMGWEADVLDSKLAVMLEDDAEIGSVPTYEQAIEAFRDREKAEAAKAEVAAKSKAKAKGKKGKAGAEDDEDLDALLEEAGMTAEPKAESKKKGKKGKAAKQDDEDDAVFDEFKPEPAAEKEEPKEEPKEEEKAPEDAKAAANRKKKEKKKANKAGGDDDDDLDAALEEFKGETPAEPEPAKVEEAETPAAGGDDEDVDAKTLANRKKKDKKKAKMAVGGGGFFKDDDAEAGEKPADAAAAESEAPAPAPAAGKKGAAPKKESAAVKAARERMEMQRQLDEEKAAFDAAEKKRIEEEERIEREEEEKAEAERKRRRDARQAKIDKQKAEGTYQTKAQKLRAERAKQLREQFGFDLDEHNAEDGEESKPAPKKAAPATKKKKQQAKKKDEDEEEAEEKPAADAKVKEATPKEAETTAPEETAEEDDGDDWEALDEKLAREAEEAAAAAAAKAAKAEEEEDEDGDDDSSSSSSSDSDDSSDFLGYRSPIVVIMGHVDTGKTKLLDKIRRTNVQEGEAGGITQQIGATFFPDIALEEQTKKVDEDFELELPGLLIIDTPGHESFNNLRKRGSSLCDIAILVIDIMHGLEPQTVESLEMLKRRKCPFVIAMNKIDVCYSWKSEHYTCIKDALGRQNQSVQQEFQQRFQNVVLQLNERGINCNLYWENTDPRSNVSIVPTSALTGEGVPDLLYMVLSLSQNLMASNLEVDSELQCSVIEVKNIEGHGTTIDVVLVNGTLREGDQIVLAGLGGPIVTTIRALLTPAPMKEMRVKGEYVHHAKIDVSMGVKISAPGLEEAIAGCELKVVGPDDDIEEIKEDVQDGFDSVLYEFDKQPAGVYVKASTLGSLEALLTFLTDMKIPVFDVGIGEVHKKDVKKAAVMKDKKFPEYAVILAFDIKVSAEATQQAAHDGVQIMTADIIYHLFDRFTQYMKQVQDAKKTETRAEAVFPVVLDIDKNSVFHKKDPIVLGCKVVAGQLRPGTPICVPEKGFIEIGRIGSIEKDHKDCKVARKGESVCIKIDQNTSQNQTAYGRHFDHTSKLYSKISRESIDTLKEHFKDEMKKEDWETIIGMKTLFKIQ